MDIQDLRKVNGDVYFRAERSLQVNAQRHLGPYLAVKGPWLKVLLKTCLPFLVRLS